MPIFEYLCIACGSHYDILHKRAADSTIIECPSCHSKQYEKKMSVFSASIGSSVSNEAPCAGGTCGVPFGDCPGGMCGLN